MDFRRVEEKKMMVYLFYGRKFSCEKDSTIRLVKKQNVIMAELFR